MAASASSKTAPRVPRAWDLNINFIGRMRFILWFSALSSLACIVCIATRGFNYGTDFAGGYEIQVHLPQAYSETQIRSALAPLDMGEARVQRFGDEQEHEYLILMRGSDSQQFTQHTEQIAKNLRQGLHLEENSPAASSEQLIKRVDYVGPQVGAQLRTQGILAVVYSLLLILLYVALRFDLFFSPGAVIATLHDVILVLGVFSLFQIEFNLTVVAAILTLIGYSLNDTIVVYDRIRENVAKLRGRELRALVNTSINETLSRTLLTSGTVFLVVTALLVLGGPFIRGFSITMFVGVIVGAYSSIAVASPLYIILRERAERRQANKKNTPKSSSTLLRV